MWNNSYNWLTLDNGVSKYIKVDKGGVRIPLNQLSQTRAPCLAAKLRHYGGKTTATRETNNHGVNRIKRCGADWAGAPSLPLFDQEVPCASLQRTA
jgi:hypothetical protein